MDYKALMDAKKAEDAIKESKVSLTKKIEKVLSLIESFNLLPDKDDPVRELVRKIKKILEEWHER